jgi:outer membrane protein assembly factor BamE (lipoprotein component of BamABCDE complex)
LTISIEEQVKMSAVKIALVLIMLGCNFMFGCMSAAQHQQSLGAAKEREMTLGVVQKEIRVGMSQADVATALGSPNIVTSDSAGKETWVYDKIASEASYSHDSGGTGLILGLGGIYSRQAGAVSSTQKTLTVVIKFDNSKAVESFTYHTSKF